MRTIKTRCLRVAGAGLLALGAARCGTAVKQESRHAAASDTGQFPSRADLQQITATPPPAKVKVGAGVDVGSWSLSGPLPGAVDDAPVDTSTPWGKALAEAAAARPGVAATAAMECFAREAASFWLANKALPGRAESRFIAGRCGVPISYVNMESAGLMHLPKGKSDGEVFALMRADADRMLAKLSAGSRFAGLGLVRRGDQAGLVLASAKRGARLDRLPQAQGEGSVVLTGELITPAERVRALVTAGRFGFAECVGDPAVSPPRFTVRCPLAKGDAEATVELVSFAAGRVLGEGVVEAVVFQGEPALSMRASPASEPLPADGVTAAALADRVNAVRREAGMRPLRVSKAESAVTGPLTPYYFAAMMGLTEVSVAEKIALGVMAGWEVEGEVARGHFSPGAHTHRDPGKLLEDLVARPFGRETLFDPQASVLAAGLFAPEDGGLGAVIGTYVLFDAEMNDAAEARQVIDRLAGARIARGLPAPRSLSELDEDARRAAARVREGASPKEALDQMLQASVKRIQRSARGWALSGPTVDALKLPDELLAWADAPLAISVAHYRPEGQPWKQLVVFIVSAVPAEQKKPETGGG